MAKAGLATGLFAGLQTGLNIGMQMSRNKEQSELNKAKIIQANNKAVGEANKAYTDELNKYNTRTDALNKRLSEASNETQRNNISKMIEASDKQFGVITQAASQAGSKLATDISANANPYIHDDVRRVKVGGKDFTVSSATYEDFKANSDTYGLSDDGRNMVRRQLKTDAPLAGTEPEYMTTVVEDGVRSDVLFDKVDTTEDRFTKFARDYRSEAGKENAPITEIRRAWLGKDTTTTGQVGVRAGTEGERDRNEWSNLRDMQEAGEELTPIQRTRLRSLNKKFDPDTYKQTTDVGNIGKGQEIFDKGFIGDNWTKADKNKAQALESQILKATDPTTTSSLKESMKTAKANNLVITQAKDIIKKIDGGEGQKGAEKGIIDNITDYVKKRVDKGTLTEKQADALDRVIRLNTRVGYLMSTYVKLLSGTAAGEKEVARISDTILGGTNVTEDVIRTAIDEFSNISKESNKKILEEVQDFMPRSAMNILGVRDKQKTPSRTKTTKKNGKYRVGQRARQNGVLFEYDGKKWNRVKE
jgi:hypothetical protein